MVIQSFAPVVGGAQRQLQSLAPLLADRGVESRCITRLQGEAPTREQLPGIDVRRMRVPQSTAGASLAYTAAGIASAVAFRPDVIHTYDLQSPSTIGLGASMLVRRPVVAKILSTGRHGDIWSLLRRPLGSARLRAMVRRFAAFISLSAAVDDELLEHGVPAERIWRIPNGVDAKRFRPSLAGEREELRRDLGIPGDEPLTLYCGRFSADSKRLDVLLESFARAPGQLLLVGEGPDRAELEARASEPGLAGRVHVRGPVDDVAPLYRSADLYASASVTEGMSGSVLEAMASGLAVAASPASGMGELVRRDTGIVASDESAETLGEALVALLGDAALRDRLGAAARARAEEEYSLELTADRLLELYAAVGADRDGGHA
jgi:glycosyltransferase involved in cell wall biosynthesis